MRTRNDNHHEPLDRSLIFTKAKMLRDAKIF